RRGPSALCFTRVAGGRRALIYGGADIRRAELPVSRGWRRIRLFARGVRPTHRLSLWMDEILDRLSGFDRRIRDRLIDVSPKFSAYGQSPDRGGYCDNHLFHRAQLFLRSLRRRGANRDDRREDSNDLRAGGVDIGVRSGHELASSQRRCLIGEMEE